MATLGKNECLCASILVYGMENRFFIVGLISSGNLIFTRPWLQLILLNILREQFFRVSLEWAVPVGLAWRKHYCSIIVVEDVADSTVVYYFYLIDVFLLLGIPDCCRIF